MDNALQKMLLWTMLLLASPILVNMIMMWQEKMGMSSLAQGATGIAWLAILSFMMLKKRN